MQQIDFTGHKALVFAAIKSMVKQKSPDFWWAGLIIRMFS